MDSDSEDSLLSSSSSSSSFLSVDDDDDDEEFLMTSKSKPKSNNDPSSYYHNDGSHTNNNNNGGSVEDREAMIRRKLLESFYGKAAVSSSSSKKNNNNVTNANDNVNANTETIPTTTTSSSSSFTPNTKTIPTNPQSPSTTDINSPSFNPTLYSQNLISTSNTHSLLSTSTSLTQSIRILDSTMQTLVYENYSKFIHATDAIRNIGHSSSIIVSNNNNNNNNNNHNNDNDNDDDNKKRNDGLQILQNKMINIENNMYTIENKIKTKRQQVVEKQRTKKLLMRLTKLLELPTTLTQSKQNKKYINVMKDYYDSIYIIGQYSNEFESLKQIEMDCGFIVRNMMEDIGKMIWVWCGGDDRNRIFFKTSSTISNATTTTTTTTTNNNNNNNNNNNTNGKGDSNGEHMGIMGVSDALDTFMRNGRMLFQLSSKNDDNDDDNNNNEETNTNEIKDSDNTIASDQIEGTLLSSSSNTISSITDVLPPQSMSEIFECTGALLAYSSSEQRKETNSSFSSSTSHKDASILLSQLSTMECKVISLQCCSKYLEGILEDHAIDVQEERLKALQEMEMKMAVGPVVGGSGGDEKNDDIRKSENHTLFPRKYLDSILEAATLYGLMYNTQSTDTSSKNKKKKAIQKEDNLLNDYVSKWFNSFLAHVRMILIDWVSEIDSNKESRKRAKTDNVMIDDQDDEDDVAFAEISLELMNLLRNVREVASGLALPEIGLDMELASTLVEKTVGITESMVKKRVSQKFHLLRMRVLKECLMPLVKNVLTEQGNENDDDSLKTIKTVQAANVALSDSMQMVDDTIRSILSQGNSLGMSNTSLDTGMMKAAVGNDTRKFAFWLASALEKIVGCDPIEEDITLSVNNTINADEDEARDKRLVAATLLEAKSMNNDDDEVETTEKHKENNTLEDICTYIEDNGHYSNCLLKLSLVEMCRLAARNVINNMNQSISSSMDDDFRQPMKKDVFQLPISTQSSNIDSDEIVCTRFRLAASRALILYATSKGYEASSAVCNDIWDSCSIQSEFFPHGPSEASWKILETVKSTSKECTAAFGGNCRAGPIPNFSEDSDDYIRSKAISNYGAARGAMNGLSLDVARMFKQKVQVYPHYSEIIDFSRSAVVVLMLKVAFKAWIEQIRFCTLSAFAYRQLQVDTEFLKVLLPHYVDEESSEIEDLINILGDIIINAGGRCDDFQCVGSTEYYDEARGKVLSPTSIAMAFLAEEEAAGKRGILGKFLIVDKDEIDDKES